MFFEMHDEKKIGYKKLSQADLGTSDTSHQTHIGLAESVLTFLSDRDALSEDSIFIYEDKFEYIDAYFDRIENPDGTFRSPKIRIGDRGCVSVVSTIRGIIKKSDPSLMWYLVWFGLKNSKIVFLLFNNASVDYKIFIENGINLDKRGTKSINSRDVKFPKLMEYIESKINANGLEVIKELEIITQVEDVKPNRRYRSYDIKKANEINSQIGLKGEELVNAYLQKQVELGQIKSYTWSNLDKETGRPYDFSIQDLRDNITYLDVKTTGYDFNQKMIFSSQEIEFIADTPNQYYIYRVFKSGNDEYLLRICDNCKSLSQKINERTVHYSNNLDGLNVGFKGSKLAIGPNRQDLEFKSEIILV